MISGKIMYTLLGIMAIILALCKFDNSSPVIEGWWGGTSFTTRNMYGTVDANGNTVALPQSYINPGTFGSNKFVSTPSFQGVLAPRMSGQIQYGANIKYNMPDRKNMAVPCDPLTFGSMAEQENYLATRSGPNRTRENFNNRKVRFEKENYDGSCSTGDCGASAPSCGKGGYGIGKSIDSGEYSVPPDYHTGNWKDIRDSEAPSDVILGGTMPVGTMNSINGSGEAEQTVVMSHIMPSNTKSGSRLFAQSDFIRGDVFVNPPAPGWFSVSPNLSRDLNAGALMAMGGMGDSALQTITAINASSGSTALGGIDISSLPKYNPNMALQTLGQTMSGNSDVMITAFP